MRKYIFCLICPITNRVKYVGHTYNPIRRYSYYAYAKEVNQIGDWFRSYGKLTPELKVLELVQNKKAKSRVEFWQNYYKENNLLNLVKNKKSELVRFFVSKNDLELIKKDMKEKKFDRFADYCRFKLLKELNV